MNNNNNNNNIKPPYTRFHYAVTDMQKNSLAELKETYKYALYEDVTTENRQKLPFSNLLPPASAYVICEWFYSIRVSQHSCSSRNTPPKDCLQYFTGTTGKDECKLFKVDGNKSRLY